MNEEDETNNFNFNENYDNEVKGHTIDDFQVSDDGYIYISARRAGTKAKR